MLAFVLAVSAFIASSARAEIGRFPPDLKAVRAELHDISVPPVPADVPAGGPFTVQGKSIWYDPPVLGLDSPEAKEYAEAAQGLAARGLDFSAVFAGLCRHLLDDPRARRASRAETANLFRGLIRWTRNGGKPAWHGREDWPLHFIYGGYVAAAYGHAAAEAAAYAKEDRDAFARGNYFDLDDLGVTLIGARWASRVGNGFKELARWAGPWASGQRALDALPAMSFGRLPHGHLPSPAQAWRLRAFVDGVLR